MIYVITNRNQKGRGDKLKFGGGFNSKGPNELRLAKARLSGGDWNLSMVADSSRVAGRSSRMPGSEACFLELQKTMRAKKRDCVFFVHGYNVSFKDALNTAERIRAIYDVEVVLFSWPANGGGGNPLKDAHGLVSYKWDKRDAATSIGALDRVFELFGDYLKKHRSVTQSCGQTINLLCHSMGSYLLKKLLSSKMYNGETLLFDNIVLASADTNNAEHAEWIDRIAHRRSLYVTINENDFALGASRFKMGDKQRARLGHYTRNLVSDVAVYLDFTDAPRVKKSHGYFVDDAIEEPRVFDVFNSIFKGRKAEHFCVFNSHTGAFDV